MSVHFSSESPEWATPLSTFEALNAEFGFDVDVCALPENAKCDRYFTPKEDGLAQDWRGLTCFMNPPYGREIKHWMRKAYDSGIQGATVVCLVPARTDTAWWHDYAMKGEIRFIRGRIKFSGHHKDAPFPCAIVIFRSGESSMTQALGEPLGELRSVAAMSEQIGRLLRTALPMNRVNLRCLGLSVGIAIALAGCGRSPASAPKLHECVDIKTGEAFRFSDEGVQDAGLLTSKTVITDKEGWRRIIDGNSVKCRDLPA